MHNRKMQDQLLAGKCSSNVGNKTVDGFMRRRSPIHYCIVVIAVGLHVK